MHWEDCAERQSRLRHLGQSLVQSGESSLTDRHVLELLEAFEEQHLARSHLARLRGSAVVDREPRGGTRLHASDDEAMKLACKQVTITADEHRCNPGQAQVFVGGRVRIAVSSGPPQSFEITRSAKQDSDETPRIPAGQHYDWEPAVPGTHTISSHIYPGCKAQVVVRPAPPPTARPSSSPPPVSSSSSMSQVDEPIRFPLRTSRAAQTDPITSTSCFTSTDTHLPPLHRPFQTANAPASVLPGITTAAAAAVTSSMFGGAEELEVFNQTGVRRRASRTGSAGSVGSASHVPLRAGTPDIGGFARGTPLASSLSAASSASSQDSPRAAPTIHAAPPVFRPVYNVGGTLQRSMSPVIAHSSEETVPLLDISMSNRVQHRPSAVYPTSSISTRAALVSPTSVASRDATHKCPRCRKEFLSTINQRRCLAVHLGHKAGAPSSKGAKGGTMPDRTQLVEFWDGLELLAKRAILNLKAEPGSESVLRNMEVRLLEHDTHHAHTMEQRTMFAAGRTLFEVLVRGKGLESLSGESLATLLTKTSESTFLYDRVLPARDESTGGYNAEAGLSAFISKRLVDALLTHRKERAEQVQRELEELEESQKGDKAKQAEKSRKKDKKAKSKPKQKPNGGKGKASSASGTLSRASSMDSVASEQSALEDSEPDRPAVEDSASLGKGPAEPGAAAAAAVASAAAAAVTPAKSVGGRSSAADSDMELTPPPTNPRYTPTEVERAAARRAAPVTYVNVLYRAEGEDASPGTWQPAVKNGSRPQHAAPVSGRPAAAGAAPGGRAGAAGEAPRSNGNLTAGQGMARPMQQQHAASGASQKGMPAESAPAAKPASKATPAAAPTSHSVQLPAGAAPTKPVGLEEAFPALPSKAAQKSDALPAVPPSTAGSSAGTSIPVAAAAPKPPAPGISYAAAAAAARAASAPAKHMSPEQQQASPSKPPGEAMGRAAPAVPPQQQLGQPAPAAAAAKPSPPTSVAPASQQSPAAVSMLVDASAPAPANPSRPAAPAGPIPDLPAAEQTAGLGSQAAAAAAAAVAEPPADGAVPAPTHELAAPAPQPAAAVQQLLAMGSAGPAEEEPQAGGEQGQAAQQALELRNTNSTTPPLEEQDVVEGQLGGMVAAVMDGALPVPPYGYPPPPMGAYYYYPTAPVPSVQFGDVDMGEILQQQQQELQQPRFFPAFPPPPMPYAAGAMLPFPPPVTMPGHPMQPPHPVEHQPPATNLREPAPASEAAELLQQQEAEQEQVEPTADSPQLAEAQVEDSAEAVDAAEQAADAAAVATPVDKAEGVEQEAEVQPVDACPACAAAPPATQLAAPQPALCAGAQSTHLARLLQHAASAVREPPAFDTAAAAAELATRWQAAVAPAQAGAGEPQQRQQGVSRSSSGASSNGAGGRAGSGGGGNGSWGHQQPRRLTAKSEWRPVLKEQYPQQAQATTGQSAKAGPWAKGQPASSDRGPALPPANGALQQRLPLSFATVAGGGAKATAHPAAGVAVRGWSSDESGEGSKWKIQAAK